MQPPNSKTSSKDELTPFHLSNSSTSFNSRSDDVFASLDQLEAKHSAVIKARSESGSSDDEGLVKDDPMEEEERAGRSDHKPRHSDCYRSRSSRSHDDQDRKRNYRHHDHYGYSLERDHRENRQSRKEFPRPTNRPPRGRKKIPDFKLHPERWTHYSLNDVTEDDMSDRSNTRAALTFLEKRRRECEKQERIAAGLPAEEPKFDVGYGACSQGRISFSKPGTHDKDPKSLSLNAEEQSACNKKQKSLALDMSCEDTDGKEESAENSSDVQNGMCAEGRKESFKVTKKMNRRIRRKEKDEDNSD